MRRYLRTTTVAAAAVGVLPHRLGGPATTPRAQATKRRGFVEDRRVDQRLDDQRRADGGVAADDERAFHPGWGITVYFTARPEDEFGDKMNQEFFSQAGQHDIVRVSALEDPIYSRNSWVAPLDKYIQVDPISPGTTCLAP